MNFTSYSPVHNILLRNRYHDQLVVLLAHYRLVYVISLLELVIAVYSP